MRVFAEYGVLGLKDLFLWESWKTMNTLSPGLLRFQM